MAFLKEIFRALVFLPICLVFRFTQAGVIQPIQNSTVCYGADNKCSTYQLSCQAREAVVIETMDYGFKVKQQCTFGVSDCAKTEQTNCCVYDSNDQFMSFTEEDRHNVSRNCHGRHTCQGKAPRVAIGGNASCYVVIKYRCVDVSDMVQMCNVSARDARTVFMSFDAPRDYFFPSLNGSRDCSCLIQSPKSSISLTFLDLRFNQPDSSQCSSVRLVEGVTNRSIDCVSASSLVSAKIGPVSISACNETVTLHNLYKTDHNDRPEIVLMKIEALDPAAIVSVMCQPPGIYLQQKPGCAPTYQPPTNIPMTSKHSPPRPSSSPSSRTQVPQTSSKASLPSLWTVLLNTKPATSILHTVAATNRLPFHPPTIQLGPKATNTKTTMASTMFTPSKSTTVVHKPQTGIPKVATSTKPVNSSSSPKVSTGFSEPSSSRVTFDPIKQTTVTEGNGPGTNSQTSFGTTSPTAGSSRPSDDGEGWNTGLIIGVVAGVSIFLIALAAIIACLCIRFKRKEKASRSQNFYRNTNIFYSFPEDPTEEADIKSGFSGSFEKGDATLESGEIITENSAYVRQSSVAPKTGNTELQLSFGLNGQSFGTSGDESLNSYDVTVAGGESIDLDDDPDGRNSPQPLYSKPIKFNNNVHSRPTEVIKEGRTKL